MSLEYVVWALRQELMNPLAKLVLIGFCKSYDMNEGRFCFDCARLAKLACVSEGEVDQLFEYLISDGWIYVKKNGDYDLVWSRGIDPWTEMAEANCAKIAEIGTQDSRVTIKETPPPDWIYVLYCDGLVKVGISYDVKKRIHQIRKEGPDKKKTKLYYKERCTPENIRSAEKIAHGLLDRRINRSDWFCDTPANAVMAVSKALAQVRGEAA